MPTLRVRQKGKRPESDQCVEIYGWLEFRIWDEILKFSYDEYIRNEKNAFEWPLKIKKKLQNNTPRR